jgi:hypothetical protein
VLEPILRDTADLADDRALGLDELEWLLNVGLGELWRHTLPTTAIHLGPEDRHEVEPVAFASFVIAHRAERLFQLVELSAAALDNLEAGSLQLAAVAARYLLEVAAASAHAHDTLETEWSRVTGSPRDVAQIAGRADSNLWKVLWGARVGTRLWTDQGWPQAINAMTLLKHLGRGDEKFTRTVNSVYDWLCEATHPNVESQAVFWRLGERDRRGRQTIRLDEDVPLAVELR